MMDTAPDQNTATRDVYSVTRLNREVRAVLEGSFPAIWVQGEISNLARPASGHMYFSLKDRSSQVRCAMFKGRNRLLRFAPDNGLEVLVRGVVSLYEGRGEFQLIVEEMEPAGEGALQRAFAELKQRLFEEGLFDAARKQPLPPYPRTIGVVTSPTGAAIRDILTVLKRRYPAATVIIYPVPVQGEGAAPAIARALETADRRAEADVLILARGGGSLEDLWSFNEEIVARAMQRLRIPIVCGVGHEIDFTIADFVADIRAPTPSAAAELASPDQRELLAYLRLRENRCITHINRLLQGIRQALLQLEKGLAYPLRRLQAINQRVDDLSLHMQQGMRAVLAHQQVRLSRLAGRTQRFNPLQLLRLYRERLQFFGEQLRRQLSQNFHDRRLHLDRLVHGLHTVSPLATLDRGYGIVTRADGSIIRDAAVVETGEIIKSRVARGTIHSRVTDVDHE
jgi:exodeoxyribonuclease VII large subunit